MPRTRIGIGHGAFLLEGAPGVGSIPLLVQWVPETGSGSGFLAFSMPLRQGDLMPANLGKVALFRAGFEVPIYVEEDPHARRYSDGSIRILHVQTNVPDTVVAGTPLTSYSLGLTTPRTTGLLTKTTIASYVTANNDTLYKTEGFPDLYAHPASTTYMCEAWDDAFVEIEPEGLELNPPAAINGSNQNWYAALDTRYTTGPTDFNQPAGSEQKQWDDWIGSIQTQGGHYGPDFHRLQCFIRTGDIRFFRHGCAYAGRKAYTKSVAGTPFSPNTTWDEACGALVYYWLTQSGMGWSWVNGFTNWAGNSSPASLDFTGSSGDGRFAARLSLWLLIGYLAGQSTCSLSKVQARLTAMIDAPPATQVINPWNGAGISPEVHPYASYYGAWAGENIVANDGVTLAIDNFFNVLIAEFLILYYRHIGQDARIGPHLLKIVTFVWDTQRKQLDDPNYATLTFRFLSHTVTGSGGPSGTVDLNGMYGHTFLWAAKLNPTEAATLVARADAIMEVAAFNHKSTSNNGQTELSGPCLACTPGKQLAQTYRTLWQWKAARRRLLA